MRLITTLRHQMTFDRDTISVVDEQINATVQVREITVYLAPDTNRPMVSYSGFYRSDVNADEKHYASPPVDIVRDKDKIPRLIYQICDKLDGVRVADYDLTLWLEGKM